jgi:hypothetical protein
MTPDNASRQMIERPPVSEGPLALRERRVEPWLRVDWQRFWLTVRGREWRSLALVPAGQGAPADFTLTIAVSLARTGMMHLGVPIRVVDATRVPLKQMMQLIDEVNNCIASGDLVIIALSTTAESPITVSVARAADSALLCIMMERMAIADAKSTVDHVGQQKFIGSAVFHPNGERA